MSEHGADAMRYIATGLKGQAASGAVHTLKMPKIVYRDAGIV